MSACLAGFQVLAHHCIAAWSVDSVGPTQPISDQTPITTGGPSRRAYLSRNDVPDFCSLGYKSSGSICSPSSSRSIDCAELCAADATPWGARVLSSEAVMLGLPLHGQTHAFGVALPELKIDAKPQATRLRIMRHLNLSVRERGMFCAFYLQSTYAYAFSVHWPTKEAMHRHRRMLSRALYPARAWIDMRALPEVLRFLRIAPVVAPEHLAVKAAIGLVSRLLAPNHVSWETALSRLPPAIVQQLGCMLRLFPGLRQVWNSCCNGKSAATAMKAHLIKFLDTLEEVAAVGFLTRRMATAAWKDRSDIFSSRLASQGCSAKCSSGSAQMGSG